MGNSKKQFGREILKRRRKEREKGRIFQIWWFSGSPELGCSALSGFEWGRGQLTAHLAVTINGGHNRCLGHKSGGPKATSPLFFYI